MEIVEHMFGDVEHLCVLPCLCVCVYVLNYVS